MKRQNLDDEIYDILFQKIMDGTYSAGEKIHLEDLALELDVSITPVLGALRKLVYDGFVTTKRGKGFFVAAYSTQDISEMLVALNHMYMIAFDHILKNHLSESIAYLRTLSQKTYAAFLSNDYEIYCQEDNAFHEAIIQVLDNRYLLEFYHNIYRKICYCFQLSIDSAERGLKTALPDNHFKICEALERGDRCALEAILISDFPLNP